MIFDVIKKAKQLFYDNKNSGLDVSNVQDAIDDLTQAIVEVDAINEGTGSPILLTDTLDDSVLDFKAYGKSVQDGEPTPDNPIDIVSVAEGGTLEIKSTGKNLIPYPHTHTTRTVHGVTATDNKDGTISMSGTPTANFWYSVADKIKLPKGKYVLSGCPSDGGGAKYYIIFRKYSDSTDRSTIDYGKGVSFEITDDSIEYTILAGVISGYPAPDTPFSPMIRRVEVTDDTYKPYKSSSISIPLAKPLRSVGNIRDEIACIDSVYGVIRRIASEVFKGDTSEKWFKSTMNANLYSRNFSDAKGGSNSSIWSHFVNYNSGISNGGKMDHSSISNGHKYACLDVYTLEEWLAWLKANPVTIQYILAEEVFEPFADQTLFDNITTYDNVTYITSTDNADMWVQYYSNSSVGKRLAKTDEQMRVEHRLLQEQIEGVSQIASAAKETAEDNALAVTVLDKDMKSVKDNQLVKSVYTDTMGYIKALRNGQVLELTATSRTLAQLQTALTSLHNAGCSPNSYVTAACRYGTSESPNNIGLLELRGTACWLYDILTSDVLTNADYKVTFNATWIVTEKSVG